MRFSSTIWPRPKGDRVEIDLERLVGRRDLAAVRCFIGAVIVPVNRAIEQV